MPIVEVDYDPELTKEKLIRLLKNDLIGRYNLFAGAWYQGKCVIVAQNSWIGAAINIKQSSRKQRTRLEVKRTIPSLQSLAIMLIVIAFGTVATIVSVRNHFYPIYVVGCYLAATLVVSQYYGFKERFAVIEIAGLLSISDELVSSNRRPV